MAFDINEARAIIEDAKKRGMIRAAGSVEKPADSQELAKEGATGAVIPDWLQEGIRQGPLSRDDQDRR